MENKIGTFRKQSKGKKSLKKRYRGERKQTLQAKYLTERCLKWQNNNSKSFSGRQMLVWREMCIEERSHYQ